MSETTHAFPNGTVSVKMHKRKRLTFVVAREDIDTMLTERIEALEHENRVLRRQIDALQHPSPSPTSEPDREGT